METIEQRARRLKKYWAEKEAEEKAAREEKTAPEPVGFWDDAEVISRYTRADAIADGVLYDVTETAKEAGFKIPVAITNGVRADVNSFARSTDDAEGRLWDLLYMGRIAAGRNGSSSEPIIYSLLMQVGRKKKYFAKLHIGPGDAGEPVLTILRPEED